MKHTALSAVFIGLLAVSCSPKNQESFFEEYTIESNFTEMPRTIGVYIPAGYDSRKTYPVIYMADGLVFTDGDYRHSLDSMIEYGFIEPVIVACSYENKMRVSGYNMAYRNAEYVERLSDADATLRQLFDAHYKFFTQEFIPSIEKKYSVSKEREDRIFYGTSNSADFGLTLSMKNPELFSEYWCFSPVFSDISGYGMLNADNSYKICWGAKEEINASFDYFPSLVQSIRKRGGKVQSWVYEGGHDRPIWQAEFTGLVSTRFAKE